MLHHRIVFRFLTLLVLVFYLALPASASPGIDDFLRETDIRDMALSPDGTHLAMVTHNNGTRTVVVRNLVEPGMPVIGTMAGDIVRPNYLYWANNNRLLVAMSVPYALRQAVRDKERHEDFDINDYYMISRMISVSKDLSETVILMQDEPGLRNNFNLTRLTNFLPNDENHVLMDAYRSNRRTLYRVDIITGETEKVTNGTNLTRRFFSDEDGKPRFRFDYLPRSRAIVLYEYVGEDEWKRLEKIYLNKDDEDSLDTAGLIAMYEDRLVYRQANEDSGFYELVVVDRETSQKSTLASLPDQDIRGALADWRTDEIIGYTVEKDYVRHVFFDAENQALYDAMSAQVGEYNFTIIDIAEEGGLALVRSWGPDNPGKFYLWDIDAQQLTLLADAYEDLGAANLSVPALATYIARDGTPIRSYILFPRDYQEGERYPTILLPHGGPHARDRATYDYFAQFLSTRGYVVVQPSFRGSVGYGQDFEEAGYRQWGGLMQDDLTDAAKYMVRKGIADPDRMCIVGASYGGYAALMGAIKTPELFQCAVSLNGVSHLTKMLKYDQKYIVDKDDWQTVLFDPVGDPKSDRKQLETNSPALHVDRIRIPVLLVTGKKDRIVRYLQSTMMAKALKKAGADYEYIELPEAGHNLFRDRKDARKVFAAIEDFLETNLQ